MRTAFLRLAAASPSADGWVAFISSFNALIACGDLLRAGLVLFQIPAHATVRNQNWREYWREHERRADGAAPAELAERRNASKRGIVIDGML